MRFEINGSSICALIENPRRNGCACSDVSELIIIPKDELSKLLEACVRYCFGRTAESKKTFIAQVLRPFGRYLNSDVAKDSGAIPKDFYEWEFLTYQFGLWLISHKGSRAKLEGRCSDWQKAICPWLNFLQEEGWIPVGVTWPDMRLPSEVIPSGPAEKAHVLGESRNRKVDAGDVTEFIDKTIAGPIFWRSDAQYLDEVEATLRKRDKVLGDVLFDYWVKLVRDFRTGKRLLSKVTNEMWLSKEEVNWRYESTCYLTSPKHIDGHLWTLRFLRQQIDSNSDTSCLRRSAVRAHPAVGTEFFKNESTTASGPLRNMSALTEEQAKFLKPRHVLNRFLGVLNNVDFSVGLALLIREHPNWNPSSLAGAEVFDEFDKSRLIINGEGEPQIFSVDKPRAKSRKYAALSRKASQVFRHILRVTAPVRALLRRSGDPRWRYLFLGDVHQGSLGHPLMIHPKLLTNSSRSKGVCLSNLYPQLTEVGLNRGTVDFSRLRNTKGVIEWFDTGSVQAVARRLGNSPRTALKHYLPASLIVLWNERIIRRFQNTLLVLAARDRDWLLDIVDMPNMAELNNFLAQSLLDLPFGSSPIADKLHELFNPNYAHKSGLSGNAIDAVLQIRLHPSSLALLLGYRQWALTHLTPEELDRPDRPDGLTPKYFVELAGMLQAAAQSNEIGERLRESLDIARLQRCYGQAVKLIPKFAEKITRLSLQSGFEV